MGTYVLHNRFVTILQEYETYQNKLESECENLKVEVKQMRKTLKVLLNDYIIDLHFDYSTV